MKRKIIIVLQVCFITSCLIIVYSLSSKIQELQSENKKLLKENTEVVTELESVKLESKKSIEPSKEKLVLRNFHCEYNDCMMNDKFIIDPNFNTVVFWDEDKNKEIKIAFNSTAQAIEFYANYMTIVAY